MRHSKIILSVCMVCLFAFQSTGQNNRNGNNSVLHQPPEADFSWVNVCFGDTSQFINGSIRGTTYKWYIYNKTMTPLDSFTTLNISYLFPSADTFYVKLIADNGHAASMTEMVIIGIVTTADFNFMHCSNQFMNHSTCATSFFWDFGDGNTSTAALPTHQYADTGYYNVKFIAYKGIYSDTATKQIFVNPDAFPTGAITYYVSNDTLFVHSADSMAGMFYNWKFGDFTANVYKRDTFHVYANPGTYIMYFSDWNTCTTAYSTDTITINTVSSINNISPTKYAVTIFPNPVSEKTDLNVSYTSATETKTQIRMLNSLGQSVFEKEYKLLNGENKLRISTTDLSQGVYSMTLQTENGIFNTKVIVVGN
jgi:PKD repeat protein